ncbi:hypothetical protein GY45DRAFT_1383890 [Cubamyces sp. BRFM 1775]|nr:hypothetical protein GY45DRAFT_1383890 [Cubamyces sp. BRFM 1775]
MSAQQILEVHVDKPCRVCRCQAYTPYYERDNQPNSHESSGMRPVVTGAATDTRARCATCGEGYWLHLLQPAPARAAAFSQDTATRQGVTGGGGNVASGSGVVTTSTVTSNIMTSGVTNEHVAQAGRASATPHMVVHRPVINEWHNTSNEASPSASQPLQLLHPPVRNNGISRIGGVAHPPFGENHEYAPLPGHFSSSSSRAPASGPARSNTNTRSHTASTSFAPRVLDPVPSLRTPASASTGRRPPGHNNLTTWNCIVIIHTEDWAIVSNTHTGRLFNKEYYLRTPLTTGEMGPFVQRFRDLGLAFNLTILARPDDKMVLHLQRPLESHMDTHGLELRNVEGVPLSTLPGSTDEEASTFSNAWQFLAVHPQARSSSYGGPVIKAIKDSHTGSITVSQLIQRAKKLAASGGGSIGGGVSGGPAEAGPSSLLPYSNYLHEQEEAPTTLMEMMGGSYSYPMPYELNNTGAGTHYANTNVSVSSEALALPAPAEEHRVTAPSQVGQAPMQGAASGSSEATAAQGAQAAASLPSTRPSTPMPASTRSSSSPLIFARPALPMPTAAVPQSQVLPVDVSLSNALPRIDSPIAGPSVAITQQPAQEDDDDEPTPPYTLGEALAYMQESIPVVKEWHSIIQLFLPDEYFNQLESGVLIKAPDVEVAAMGLIQAVYALASGRPADIVDNDCEVLNVTDEMILKFQPSFAIGEARGPGPVRAVFTRALSIMLEDSSHWMKTLDDLFYTPVIPGINVTDKDKLAFHTATEGLFLYAITPTLASRLSTWPPPRIPLDGSDTGETIYKVKLGRDPMNLVIEFVPYTQVSRARSVIAHIRALPEDEAEHMRKKLAAGLLFQADIRELQGDSQSKIFHALREGLNQHDLRQQAMDGSGHPEDPEFIFPAHDSQAQGAEALRALLFVRAISDSDYLPRDTGSNGEGGIEISFVTEIPSKNEKTPENLLTAHVFPYVLYQHHGKV